MRSAKTKFLVRLSVIGCFTATVIGCGAGPNETNVELITDMMDQVSLKSQDYDEARDTGSNRQPPAGTVARNRATYRYSGDPLAAEANLKNPFAGNEDEKFFKRGEEKYNIYCGLCHGLQGNGDGQIAAYLALKPPPLVSDKVKAFKDGRIFHIITEGQGVMGNYGSQIQNPDDRWAIVNYIRSLQRK